MDPLTIAVISISLIGLGYLALRPKKPTDVQVHSGISPTTGQKITVAVPVNPDPENQSHPAIVMPKPKPIAAPSGPPVAPNEPKNYAPKPVILPSTDGVLHLAPTIITPTGASSLAIQDTKDVQNALNTLNIPDPPLVVDGIAGDKTTHAVKLFQMQNGLVMDGNVGPETKAALATALAALSQTNSAAGGAHPVVQMAGPTTPAVTLTPKQIQHGLNVLGAKPPLVEDGQLGQKSKAAIIAFQMTHGLTADGIAGPKTQAALSIAVQQAGQTL